MSYSTILTGPAHSGKSTLAGYIRVHKLGEDQLRRWDDRIRMEVGGEYDSSRRFAYYVDTAASERKKGNKIGTSEFLHVQDIVLENDGSQIRLIDAPGSNMKWKSRYTANFYGDIAVIVIDLHDFIDLTNKAREREGFLAARKRLLWPIYLWKESKGIDSLIIAISKMDGNEYSKGECVKNDYDRFSFARAMSIINMDTALNEIPIIPISVDIKNRTDENVYTKSLKMPWYEGGTLLDAIQEKKEKILSITSGSIPYVFASIERGMRIKETLEPAFRIKVTNGELKKKDSVYITQVSSSEKLPFRTGKATVKSLKLEAGELKNSFVKGDIGGVTLSKITIDGKAVNASDIRLSRASYIVDERMDIRTGNLLFIRSHKYNKDYSDIQLQDKINMLMFGKIVSTVLVAKRIEDGYCCLCVYTNNYPITLPVLEDKSLPFPNYVIEKANTDFMAVTLYDFQNITSDKTYMLCMLYQGKEEKDYEQMLSEIFKTFHIIKNTEKEFSIKININNIEKASRLFRRFIKSNHVDEYAVDIVPIKPQEEE